MGQPKFYLLIIAVILLGSWIGFYSEPKIVEPNASMVPKPATSSTSAPITNTTNNSASSSSSISTPSLSAPASSDPALNIKQKDVRHIDMLSEEMKQSIRDKLFHHGPKETITRDDGTIILPANGRFTQMPVAVQMPDGTIKIQEYSVLPK